MRPSALMLIEFIMEDEEVEVEEEVAAQEGEEVHLPP